MRKHVRLLGSVLVVGAMAYGSYLTLSPAPSADQPAIAAMDPFGTCTQASLDRTSGETRLGYCPAAGTVSLTAGLR